MTKKPADLLKPLGAAPAPAPASPPPPTAPSPEEGKKNPPETPKPPVIVTKFRGEERSFDITKPEDQEALRNFAQLGMLSEKQTAEIRRQREEYEAKLAAAERDARIGADFREYITNDPVAGGLLGRLYEGMKSGAIDPNQVQAALAGHPQDGDEHQHQPANIQAGGGGQTNQLLRQLIDRMGQLESNQQRVDALQTKRDREAEVSALIASDPWLASRKAASERVKTRALALVDGGMECHAAATLAAQELKDLLNEDTETRRQQLEAQKQLATLKPSDGSPMIPGFTPTRIDPTLPRREQSRLRRESWLERFRSMKQGAGG